MKIKIKDQHHHSTGPKDDPKVKKLPYKKSHSVKFLEAMANDEARRKNPSIPAEWLAPRKYRDDSANGLTKCIIDFIRFAGGQAERINNTGRQIDTRQTFTDVLGSSRTIGQTKWIKGTGTKGTADISATIVGKSVKIEVKIGHDKQSAAQKQFQNLIEQAGGIYIVASTFEQFFHWFNLNFVSDATI
jgi:hypothetical protein